MWLNGSRIRAGTSPFVSENKNEYVEPRETA
jgi:hypothetical protein